MEAENGTSLGKECQQRAASAKALRWEGAAGKATVSQGVDGKRRGIS